MSMISGEELSIDEFLDLVDQAIFEMEDILVCAEDEGGIDDDQLSNLLPLYEHLTEELKRLHANMMQGTHDFGQGKELEFAPLVQKWGKHIPFRSLLTTVIESYKTGRYETPLQRRG